MLSNELVAVLVMLSMVGGLGAFVYLCGAAVVGLFALVYRLVRWLRRMPKPGSDRAAL